MISLRSALATSVFLATALLAAGGCTHIAYTRGSPSNPSNPSSPGPTATPGPCNTTQASGAVIIPMADVFESTATPPPYGAVNGYGPPDFTPGVSGLVPTPAPIQIRPNSQVQFENVEGFFNNFFTSHSAAFVSTTAFTPNYSFTGETKQIGASIGGSTVWSTGPIPASDGAGNTCYSQVLKIDAQSGTVYFGDIAFYNGANFRNVFIISTAAAQPKPASRWKR
jgi:hypothetical protein